MNATASSLLAAIFRRKQCCPQFAAAAEKSHRPNARPRLRLLLVWLILFGMTKAVSAQSDLPLGDDISSRPFWVNVLYFRDGAGETTLVEVLIEVPFASCVFKKAGDGYAANVEIGVIFEDAGGFQVDGKAISDLIRTDDFAATGSRMLTHIFYFAFRVVPGSYSLRIMVGDELLGSRYSYTCKIDVPSFTKKQLQLSSLLLARHLEMSANDSILRKNGRSLIPNVPHLFAAQNRAGFVYFEAYNFPANFDTFQVHLRLIHQGREIYSGSWKNPKPGKIAAINLPLHFSGLAAGEYGLLVTVADQHGKNTASAFAVLYVAPTAVPTLGFLHSAGGSSN